MPKAYVTRVADVAELVISAPPLNLFDGQLAADLEAALDEVTALTRDRAARAVLLRAEGKVFCAGVDVHEFQGLGSSQGAALMAASWPWCRRWSGCRCPRSRWCTR